MGEYYNTYLAHHGIKGQKWGVRRYQNKDGSLTPAGKKRMQVFKDASDMAVKGKKYADDEYARFTKMAEREEAKKGKNISKKQIDKYLRDEFGDDIDSKSGRDYIKDVYEIDDLDAYARKNLSGGDAEHFRNTARKALEKGEAYVRLQKKFSSMTVNDIDKKDIKQAKEFAKICLAGHSSELAQLHAFELDARDWNRDKWLEYTDD